MQACHLQIEIDREPDSPYERVIDTIPEYMGPAPRVGEPFSVYRNYPDDGEYVVKRIDWQYQIGRSGNARMILTVELEAAK